MFLKVTSAHQVLGLYKYFVSSNLPWALGVIPNPTPSCKSITFSTSLLRLGSPVMKLFNLEDRLFRTRGQLLDDAGRRGSWRTNRGATLHPGQLDEGQRPRQLPRPLGFRRDG